MENKQLYIVLTHTGSYVSKTINLFTHDKYSHVSIAFDKKCKEMYSFGRKLKYFPLYGGFNKENLGKGLFRKRNSIIAIYEINVTEEQYNEAKKRVNLIKEKNKGYNIIGLFLAEFKIKLDRKKYYCSEFVYDILSCDKVNVIKNKNFSFKPEELIDNLKCKLIYEGKIREFVKTI